jgi:hypothetical protein
MSSLRFIRRTCGSASRQLTLALLLAGLVAAAGCGEETAATTPVHPVRGTITLKGQPTPGAIVALHPKTPLGDVPTPRANVDKAGNFSVSTYAGGDGAPAGEYVVTVQWYKPVKNGPDVVAGPNVVPRKFGTPATSTLFVTVAAGDNTLPPIRL